LVLQKVIHDKQSAFLKNRGLLDSMVVANKLIDVMKRKKKDCVIIKVDFEKTYDTVSWEFLEYIMARLGYNKWILTCLRYV